MAGAGEDDGSPERGWISTDYPRGPRAPSLDTMAQQSVTRVTGRRCGCHHKTFQLVIANINVAAAHARCRVDSHARTTRRAFSLSLSLCLCLFISLALSLGTRARVPETRTLLFPLSTGWKTTTMTAAAKEADRRCCFFVNRYGSRFRFIVASL